MSKPCCPICGKEFPETNGGAKHRPFCSARCRQVDLQRWFKEAYHVPVETGRATEEAPPLAIEEVDELTPGEE